MFFLDGTTVVSCARDKYIYFDSLEEPVYESGEEEDAIPYFSRHCLYESEYKVRLFIFNRQIFILLLVFRVCISTLQGKRIWLDVTII